MENSNISWCDHTFSPWRGCQKLSPACTNCYADAMSKRNPKTLGVFGTEAQGGTRVVAAESYWKQPLKWNREAAIPDIPVCAQCGDFAKHEAKSCSQCGLGIDRSRPRVFCASISDVFEDWSGPMMNHKGERLFFQNRGDWRSVLPASLASNRTGVTPVTMNDVRRRLFDLIDATPNLDWLLLTKRPENIRRMLLGSIPKLATALKHECGTPEANIWHRPNCWLGTTVENQEYADKRVPELLKCRDLSPVLFLSCEPLLGAVDLRPKAPDAYAMLGKYYSKEGFDPTGSQPSQDRVLNCFPEIDWVIAGGESGPGARPSHPSWFRSIRDQCASGGVPFHFKQWGQYVPGDHDCVTFGDDHETILPWHDKQGSDITPMVRVGVNRAGRLLDGKEYNEFPEVLQL